MPDAIPLELDLSGPEPKLKRMPAGDVVKPDRMPAATQTVQGAVELADTAPPAISGSSATGSAGDAARSDHVHAHGNQAGGALHAAATSSVAGFMSAADKAALDGTASAISSAVASEASARASADSGLAASVAALDAAAEKLANKNQANGYCGLEANGRVAISRLAAGTPDGTKFVRDDGQLATPPGGGGGGPPLEDGTPQPLGSASAGTSGNASRGDHVHAHGNQAGGGLHADVVAGGASGFMSGADKTKLNGVATGAAALGSSTPASVAGSSSAGSATVGAREDHAHAHGAQTDPSMHALATPSAHGFMSSADKAKFNGIQSGAVALGNSTPQRLEYEASTGTATVAAREDHQHGRRARLWTPASDRKLEMYRSVRRQGAHTAGEQGDTSGLSIFGAHSYPLMLWAGLDVNGFPHYHHKRLESSNAGNDSGENGYEFGHDVAAGDFRDGRALVFRGAGEAQNVGWSDAFWDWRLDLNPTAGVYAGTYRMRMVSPELGITWSGALPFDYEVVLESVGYRAYKFRGRWTIYAASGVELRSWKQGGLVTGGFDWLANAARVQLAWRVDRDKSTRLNTYDNTNQGSNQGANLLRCKVESYGLDFVGFEEA